MCCGRGFGKTRAGAETVLDAIRNGARRVAVVGRSAADCRDTIIEGESGLLACARGEAVYEPSKRRIVFQNGAQVTAYSADKPDQLRGPQHDFAWVDELAAFRYPEAFDQLMLGLRLGDNPRCVVTTTPRPRRFLKRIMEHPKTVVTTGATMDNAANLPEEFLELVYDKYKGTSMGRQELEGKFIDSAPGALWRREMIDEHRAPAPDLVRVVVAVDPATTSHEESDESGLVVVGADTGGHFYVLADASFRGTPDAVMAQAVALYDDYQADSIIVEQNQGGDTWRTLAHMVNPSAVVKSIHATRGKYLRAEPVAARYEQGRVHHCATFDRLEDELCAFVQDGTEHDDRVDALVHGVTYLDDMRLAPIAVDANKHYTPLDSAIWG